MQSFEEKSNGKDIEIPKYYSFTIKFNATYYQGQPYH